jgi:hypothetical protein
LRAIDLGREWRVIPRDLEAFLAMHATCGATSLPVRADGGPPVAHARGGDVPSPARDGRSQSRGSPDGP